MHSTYTVDELIPKVNYDFTELVFNRLRPRDTYMRKKWKEYVKHMSERSRQAGIYR